MAQQQPGEQIAGAIGDAGRAASDALDAIAGVTSSVAILSGVSSAEVTATHRRAEPPRRLRQIVALRDDAPLSHVSSNRLGVAMDASGSSSSRMAAAICGDVELARIAQDGVDQDQRRGLAALTAIVCAAAATDCGEGK